MSILLKIGEIKESFSQAKDWEERYRLLMQMGKSLAPMDAEFEQEKYRIKGCQSQVWLYPKFDGDKVHFEASSDALLVKGIIALLVKVYSGESPEDILNSKSDFLKELGITDHLSMNRSNGLAAMVKQIQLYALAYKSLKERV